MAFSAIFTLPRHCHSTIPLSHFQISIFHRAPIFSQYFHSRRQFTTTIMSSASETAGTAAEETKLTAPYGSWKSPITADIVSGSDKRLGGFATDSLGRLYWLESRPTESGYSHTHTHIYIYIHILILLRNVLVRQAENERGTPTDITPKDFAVRSVAQEYGGGAFSIVGDSVVFSNYKDQRLYKQSMSSKDSAPMPLTPDYSGPLVCYADGVFDSRFNRYLTVREDRRESSTNPTTTIVSVDLCSNNVKEPEILVGGNDFYAFPRIDHKGERVAWIEWGHPNMPWDRSELWVGYLSENGEIKNRICVAGGDPSIVESPTEPKWSPEGNFSSSLIEKVGSGISTDGIFDICHLTSVRDKYNGNTLTNEVENAWLNGRSYLGILDVTQSKISLLDVPFTDINNITSSPDCLYVEGASAVHPLSIAKVILDDQKSKAVDFKLMWSSSSISSSYRPYISVPELIVFPTEVPGESAAVHSVMAANIEIDCLDAGELLMSMTAAAAPSFCFGLKVDSGKVDGERLCITGGSAGGYTTLAALAFRDTFKAGASLYGVADLASLRADTHKFESHYIDNLVGNESVYFERSPINHVDKFSCPIILFQGLEDKVVLPNQARKIYQALKDKGLPVALVEYEGEQHGFRKAENIKFTLEQQTVFFARLVGNFQVADDIAPIKIDNLD
ncbi:hypothetical protein DH2020_027219 [Rehmannia glutinosa]|uniref:Peptidase S9 prolyl oligopeptidase catalytic domain-containing protein n=1 Tax=Rehmannia glutinosa TaxID=99300 RepID=A0ABR0VUX8_REHGL